ncbi:MAG TPA: BON domain-containing protein [Microvirga sp.]|nr:BON domain-containing protein [Microvirga sp.]
MPDNEWWRSGQERYRDQDRDREDEYGRGRGEGRYEDWGGRAGRGRFGGDEGAGGFAGGPGREMRGREGYAGRGWRDQGFDEDRGERGRTPEYGGGSGREGAGRWYGQDWGRGAERGRGGWGERFDEPDQGYGRERGRGGWGERFDEPDQGYGRERGGPWEARGGRGVRERAGDALASPFRDDRARGQEHWRQGGEAASHRGRGPKGYQRSDDRIREDVSDRLTDDPHVDASEIEITVAAGEVTLSGTVNSRFEKRHAEDVAESVPGVRHVQNNLRVNQQAAGGAWAGTSATLGTAARRDLVRTKGSPDDFVTGTARRDAAETDTGDVPGPGLGSV